MCFNKGHAELRICTLALPLRTPHGYAIGDVGIFGIKTLHVLRARLTVRTFFCSQCTAGDLDVLHAHVLNT